MTDVAGEIREWLEKGGRPLEMRVARDWLAETLQVEQSPFFTDHESGEPREIDVVAIFSDIPDLICSMAVECKSNAEPFIVVLPSRSDSLDYRCVSQLGRLVLPLPRDSAIVDLNATPLFDPFVPTGHSILTKTSPNAKSTRDKGWQAAMSAAKAAHWFSTRYDGTTSAEAHISFPIVVTDSVLATAELMDDFIKVELVDHARFVLKWPLGRATAVLVDVVTERALPKFVRGCSNASGLLGREASRRIRDGLA